MTSSNEKVAVPVCRTKRKSASDAIDIFEIRRGKPISPLILPPHFVCQLRVGGFQPRFDVRRAVALISDFVFPIIENQLSRHRHTFTHGVNRMAAFIGGLDDFNHILQRRLTFDLENITDALRRVGKIFNRELAGQVVGHA
jgi:hypothetical protein